MPAHVAHETEVLYLKFYSLRLSFKPVFGKVILQDLQQKKNVKIE